MLESMNEIAQKKIEQATGSLYSDCFSRLNFSKDHLQYQGRLLARHLGITEKDVRGKVCLDGGCGHGTLSYQMLKLGAAKVYGVDLQPTPREDFFSEFKNMHFVKASLLALPFENNSFDFVATNGVLHHTADPEKAASELVRVLKPGGKLIIGVYGKHGLFPYCLWLVRLFTVKFPIIPERLVRNLIDFFGMSPMMRYQILDYVYVPMLARYSPKEVAEKFFIQNGMPQPARVFNLSAEEAREFRRNDTVYTYDPRTLSSKILFGYGFITMTAEKPKS